MISTPFLDWLTTYFGSPAFSLAPLTGDASLRRYYRMVHLKQSYIAMDAQAEKEKCPQFIAIANALRLQGVNTPEIYAKNLTEGFLLLTDFGDGIFLEKITIANADWLYPKALLTLATISQCKHPTLPIFSEDFMRDELFLFQEWFLEKYVKLSLDTETKSMLASQFSLIAKKCAQQPYAFMHRDFHAANLMVLKNNEIGVLDFQDAFHGPITYDLVSFVRDCYIEWPKEKVTEWILQYHQMLTPEIPFNLFLEMVDWMGMQRHLKALLTFSRKFVRDHQPNYLQHISRTINYFLQESESYSEIKPLREFLSALTIKRRYHQSEQRGMILAAGRGLRMGELTVKTPKALLRIGGRYLIDYSIHALKTMGIREIVINVSYLADQIISAIGDGSRYGIGIEYSYEEEPLETGGGIFKALPLLGPAPFIVLSSDVISDYALKKLPKNPQKLAHLVLVKNPDFHPAGDFGLEGNKILPHGNPTFTFGNIGIYRPELFLDAKAEKFRLGELLKQAIQCSQVTGECYDGFWENFGMPHQLENKVALPNILL